MNLNHNPTIEELRELVRRCDDSAGHHVLWVRKSGDVEISVIPDDLTPIGFQQARPDMQLRMETFQVGNEYVGPAAADDEGWISELFDSLLGEWATAKGAREVAYVDTF